MSTAAASMKDLMISRVRVKILELFISNTEQIYYVREITRKVKAEINAVRRELERMVEFSLLETEQRGNRLYYSINKNYPFYPELQRMVAKTTGVGGMLRKKQRTLGQIQFAMVSGRLIRGLPPRNNEVDLLVIGEIDLQKLSDEIKGIEQKIGREIAFTVLSSEEFDFRKTRRDPFVMEILYGPIVMVIGSEEEFADRQIEGL